MYNLDMNDTTLSYAAGFFDGEGSIIISLQRQYHTLNAQVANTHIETLEWLKSTFGGQVYLTKPTKPHHRICGIWRIRSRQAQAFLEAIVPHLKIKKEQAQLGVSLEQSKPHGTTRITQEVFDWREAIRTQIRILNHSKYV